MTRARPGYADLLEQYRTHVRDDRRVARRAALRYRQLSKREKDARREAEASVLLGELDTADGRLESAVARFRESLRGFRRLEDPRGTIQARIGLLQALALLGEGRAARREIGILRSTAPRGAARAWAEVAIGNALGQLGDERASEEAYDRALRSLERVAESTPVGHTRATARLNRGVRRARRGAVKSALEDLEAASRHFDGAGLRAYAAVALHNRGWAYGVAGDLAPAFVALRDAQAAFQRIGDRRRWALAILDEAELCLRLGSPGQAGRLAVRSARTLHGLGAAPEEARARIVHARALEGSGRSGEARRRAGQALDLFRAAGDTAGAALAKVLLDRDPAGAERALLQSGHLLAALEALLRRCRKLPPARATPLLEKRLRLYPAPLRRWIRPELHRMLAAAPGLTPARRIRQLRLAVRAAEDLRLRAPTGALRATVLGAWLGAYRELAEALLERGRPRDLREAFLALDSARARTLRDEMEREAPGLGDAPEVREQRERVETLWRSLEARESDPDALRGRAPARLLRDVRSAERALMDAMERNAEVGGGPPMRAHLPGDACLAFDRLGDELVGLICRGGLVETWSCGRLAPIRKDLDDFHFQVARRLHGAQDSAAALHALERLGQRLLGRAPDLGKGGRLCVVLEPRIGSLPLCALPEPARGSPLLERFQIYHAPAAHPAPRRRRRGRQHGRRRRPLLIGIDDRDLPAVRGEISTLRRLLGGAEVLEGKAATRAAVLDAIRGSSWIHLAGHAQARPDLPPLSGLALSDGWLAAADLANVGIEGAAVVLSACRTGDPALRWRGEAMGGFPRSLLAAGADAIVASRWEVSDGLARLWMEAFYLELSRGGATWEAALSRAAHRIRAQSGHPADWAAFLIIRGGSLERP